MSQAVTVIICNKKGLHARPAAKFVRTVESFNAEVRVTKVGDAELPEVAGTSILGLMMLGADKGTVLSLSAQGAQAAEVIASLKELIENRFGESE